MIINIPRGSVKFDMRETMSDKKGVYRISKKLVFIDKNMEIIGTEVVPCVTVAFADGEPEKEDNSFWKPMY